MTANSRRCVVKRAAPSWRQSRSKVDADVWIPRRVVIIDGINPLWHVSGLGHYCASHSCLKFKCFYFILFILVFDRLLLHQSPGLIQRPLISTHVLHIHLCHSTRDYIISVENSNKLCDTKWWRRYEFKLLGERTNPFSFILRNFHCRDQKLNFLFISSWVFTPIKKRPQLIYFILLERHCKSSHEAKKKQHRKTVFS